MKSRIEWNRKTLRLVARSGNYARMIRLSNGNILCGYEYGPGLWAKRSRDNGLSWEKAVPVVFGQPNGNFANAELLLLHNGDVLFFSNFRPFQSPPQNSSSTPSAAPSYAIGVSRSRDGGASWSPVEIVYRAGTQFANGCWEPVGLQLPSGEIRLFFADEAPYTRSDEQQISQMRSFDGGKSWTAPRAVAFRAGHRDGMPVPLLLQNGDVMLAIEDSGLSGHFKPVIVQLQSASKTNPENAKSDVISVGGSHPARWGALKTPLEAPVYAGAPFLRQMASGETVLSFQQANDGNMNHSQMTVCLGDARARNFANLSQPFGQSNGPQLWNALFVKDEKTLTAITSTKIGEVFGIWAIDGEVVRGTVR